MTFYQIFLLLAIFFKSTHSEDFNCTLLGEDGEDTDFLQFDVFPPEVTNFDLVISCSSGFSLNQDDHHVPRFDLGNRARAARVNISVDFFDATNMSTNVDLKFDGSLRGFSNFAEYLTDISLVIFDAGNREYKFDVAVNVTQTGPISALEITGAVMSSIDSAIDAAQEVVVGEIGQTVFQVKNDVFNATMLFTSLWHYREGSARSPSAISTEGLPRTSNRLQPVDDHEDHMLFRWVPSVDEAGNGYVFGFQPFDEANFYSDQFVSIMATTEAAVPPPPVADDNTAIYVVVGAIVTFIILYIVAGCCYNYCVNGEARLPHAYFWAKLCPGCCMWTGSRDYLNSLDMDNMNEEAQIRGRFVSTDSFLEYGSVPAVDEKERPKLIL